MNVPWQKVAAAVGNRTSHQCHARYGAILQQGLGSAGGASSGGKGAGAASAGAAGLLGLRWDDSIDRALVEAIARDGGETAGECSQQPTRGHGHSPELAAPMHSCT